MKFTGLSTYARVVAEKLKGLEKVFQDNDNFTQVVEYLFESLKSGGVWHVFATGHSTMAVQEAFHRAGGLIPVNPWLEEYVMPQAGPLRNGAFEKLPGLSQIIFDYYQPKPGELLTIISNSGINATPVEMALVAKQKKIKTLAITNLDHSKKTKSRAPSGQKLYEVCDFVLDTGGVVGDAVVSFSGLDVPVGPLSTVLNAFIINSLVVSVCEFYEVNKLKAPVYLSANLPDGSERNRVLEQKYADRIPRLR